MSQGKTLNRATASALYGFRPRLQDEDLPGSAVLAPFDIHRAPVVLLDDERLARKREDIRIGEREARALGNRHVDRCDASRARLRVDHLDGFAAEILPDDGVFAGAQRRLIDVEFVRIDRALYDGLTQAV